MDSTQAWPRCAEATAFFERRFHAFAAENSLLGELTTRLLRGAGVALPTLVDHWRLPASAGLTSDLKRWGWEERREDGESVWVHPRARLPRVRLSTDSPYPRLALAVEDVSLFLDAHGLTPEMREGAPDSPYEEARIPLPAGALAVVARRGYAGFRPGVWGAQEARRLARARLAFRERGRDGDEHRVLKQTSQLFRSVSAEIGRDRAVDEFFAAERAFYMGRNAAARGQYARQQALGIGWANHDHHTYRSSRAGFRPLMTLWREMGFVFRERFYAGAEAGWGAQILEHPVSRVVIFADVDMAPEELDIDFAAIALAPRDELGTIGLWCALHGSSIAGAGMHHLECEFDFERAQAVLEASGIGVMAPFTDLPVLKQAFTQPELWAVPPERVQALRAPGLITPAQADTFLRRGAAGSHLEVLQRWDGFKGFSKTGVSAIITETDARRAASE